ncbi:MAG TPA: hypothetical protein VGH02_02395 [Rhizomicrobium sp.]
MCLTFLAAAQPVFAESGPLAPGKAAGVEPAQNNLDVGKLEVVGAVGLVVVSVVLIFGTHYNDYPNAKRAGPPASSTR